MTEVPSAPVTDRDVYITRSFRAPREIVWKFWTEPDRLAEWFGPDGFHTPVEGIDVDLREGGSWSLGMNDASGNVYPLTSRITRVIPPVYLEMIVGARSSADDLEHIVLRVQFHDHGDTTRMTLHQGPFDDPAVRDLTTEGWQQSFAALDIALARQP